MRQLEEAALAGALALGGYELYHLHQYGNLGFGNPYNNYGHMSGYGLPYGAPYGASYGYEGQAYGYPLGQHHHHHHHML